MVLCTADDAGRHVPYSGNGAVRKIVAFDAKTVLVGGRLLEQPTGWVWMRIADRKSASDVMAGR